MRNKGFTLVELLVVVAIIAILSVIGLTIFTSAQSNARDARRKSDIEAIANALEITRNSESVYYLCLPAKSTTACDKGTATGFSGGKVPVDSTDAKYCLKTGTSFVAEPSATDINAWGSGPPVAKCPTGWTEIPEDGIPAGTAPFSSGANITYWKVCAKLENPGSGSKVACKSSAQ